MMQVDKEQTMWVNVLNRWFQKQDPKFTSSLKDYTYLVIDNNDSDKQIICHNKSKSHLTVKDKNRIDPEEENIDSFIAAEDHSKIMMRS